MKVNWTLSDEQKAQASMQINRFYDLSASTRSLPTMRGTDDEMHVESSMLSTAPGYITQSGTPTDEEFESISSRFGDPRANIKPTDYYAFRMIASGDGLDSYFTRQDVETSFANFVRDLHKGQSVLGSHQMATFSYGSSFDGEVIPAEEDRSEYEGAFYPQWDTPDLRTKNWLVGKYFIGRGVTVNNQSTNDLIRAIELGNVRKASISFMVGQYVCGIDGRDLISTMFGPMPDEECSHFPGIAYDGQIAWALMKNNTLVETSLVYKNASPSSMLLRKAEALASRGSLSEAQIEQLEGRFQVRLPRFQQRLYTFSTSTPTAIESSLTSNTSSTANATVTVTGTEESDMAGRRRGGDNATRELAREALTAEPTPEQEDAAEAEAETEVETTDEASRTVEEQVETPEDEGEGEAEDETESGETEDEAPEVEAEAEPEVEESVEEPVAAEAEVPEAEVSEEPEAEVSESADDEEVATSETSRVEDVVADFGHAAERLAAALARNPDAFDSGALAVAARAERAVDLALIDAGCDTTAGGYVARTFETRSKHLNEALGEPMTVEAIRRLQANATLGETLYEELVKDAVAARTTSQGESFNKDKYRDLLMAARDVAYVKEEIDSWKEAKKDRFTPGRSVVPRQPVDVRSTKDERKTLPEAPAAAGSKGRGAPSMSSILEPRKK